MKLYMHPASTTCRPVMQFIADARLDVENVVVDIFKGEHYGEAYTKLNPNRLVPLLEDGDFRLTESATILRYLAEKAGSPAYPKELRRRAKVDELLDWFNSNFYRDWGYGLVYPQVFPNLKRADAAVQAGTIAWGRDKSKHWLQVLNDHWIGPGKTYLLGADITIADYFGVALVTIGELIHCDFGSQPNIARWLAAMKARPSYAEVYKVFEGFAASTKGQAFERV
ncbi:MAG TPA: glutathione S-transferase family protein [Stellaceae bacterium]|nr:glutathione S-transferase family protein [Stellaceae bacterium]